MSSSSTTLFVLASLIGHLLGLYQFVNFLLIAFASFTSYTSYTCYSSYTNFTKLTNYGNTNFTSYTNYCFKTLAIYLNCFNLLILDLLSQNQLLISLGMLFSSQLASFYLRKFIIDRNCRYRYRITLSVFFLVINI